MTGDDQGTGEGPLPSEGPRDVLARPTTARSAGLPGQERLRILIANSHEEVLEHVARVVADLGHHLAGERLTSVWSVLAQPNWGPMSHWSRSAMRVCAQATKLRMPSS